MMRMQGRRRDTGSRFGFVDEEMSVESSARRAPK